MRVISNARLKQFWEVPGHDSAEGPLQAWYTHVDSRTVSWKAWGNVKASFSSASIVGDCVVFNVGGNKYRLICRVRYATQKVFVLKIMTHGEYDKNTWKDECGCHEPPPPPTKGVTDFVRMFICERRAPVGCKGDIPIGHRRMGILGNVSAASDQRRITQSTYSASSNSNVPFGLPWAPSHYPEHL